MSPNTLRRGRQVASVLFWCSRSRRRRRRRFRRVATGTSTSASSATTGPETGSRLRSAPRTVRSGHPAAGIAATGRSISSRLCDEGAANGNHGSCCTASCLVPRRRHPVSDRRRRLRPRRHLHRVERHLRRRQEHGDLPRQCRRLRRRRELRRCQRRLPRQRIRVFEPPVPWRRRHLRSGRVLHGLFGPMSRQRQEHRGVPSPPPASATSTEVCNGSRQ